MEKNLKKQLAAIYEKLLATYGMQECYLHHCNEYELLVATILSAQCTDKKVNAVTPGLFQRYPDIRSMARASLPELEKEIHPCGFYHSKAKNILGACKKIVSDFNGNVPRTMEDLTALPGVGRKTANVVLGDAFGIPGLPVDTHVKRIMNLIGAVHTDDPEKIEQILCAALPEEQWAQFSHLIILHGRTRCPARRPDCADCEIRRNCEHAAMEKGQKQVRRTKT